MFAALRVYNYRLFFLGQGTSVAGSWMQNIAVSWVVLQVTHSGVALGAVTAARFVPLLLFGPLGGLITDRSDKRRLLFVTQTCAALLSLILALLSWSGRVSLPALILIVVGLGLVNVFDGPARQALISNMVGRDRIANAIALNSIAMNTSRIVGPGVGGAIIATVGITPCFFVNAASFGAVIVSLLAMRSSELIPSEREVRSKGQVRAGLRYIAGTPALLAPLVMVTVAGTFAWEFPVTLPLMTSATFHSDAAVYGTIMSCLGAGSIVGGLFAARRRHLSVRSLAISATIWGVLIAAAAAAPTLPVEYAVIVLVGAGAVTFNSAAKTLLQLESAPQMRGRVMSLWSMAWQGSTVIGAPIVGAVAALAGARFGLLVGGAATIVMGVFYVAAGRSKHQRTS
jgi:MFS family permease